MPKRALTAAAVGRLKPPASGQVEHFDAGHPGLALRISYGGARSWVYFYRLHGKQRRLTLGTFPAMGLAEARDAWREAKAAVGKRMDPAAAKIEAKARQKETPDLQGLVVEYEAVARKAGVKSWMPAAVKGTREGAPEPKPEARRRIESVFAKLLPRTVTDITANDFAVALQKHPAPGTASRARAYAKSMADWAAGRGRYRQAGKHRLPKLAVADLAEVYDPQPSGDRQVRERYLDDAELTKIWKVVSRSTHPYGAAFRALCWTGSRLNEIVELRWKDIDFNKALITKRDVKSTRGGTRSQVLPVPAVMLEELSDRRGNDPEDRVYATASGGPLSNWDRATKRIAKAAGVGYIPAAGADALDRVDWHRQDIRRSISTGLVLLGFPPHVPDSILGHTNPFRGQQTSAVVTHYTKVVHDEQRRALEAWAAHLDRLIAERPNNVVALAEART